MKHKAWEGSLYVLLRVFVVVAFVCIAVAVVYPPESIRGATGATGAQGADGQTGASGEKGSPGKDGKTGGQGKQGDTGAKGANFWGGK